jgi:hypothetical protein
MISETEQQNQQVWYWSREEKQVWVEGEWTTEPDKIQWRDCTTNLLCLILRNYISGGLCGYVGVDNSHPLFGLDYEGAEKLFSIRWEITYCALSQKEYLPKKGIHWVSQQADPDQQIWWFGFAPDKWTDISPLMHPHMFNEHPLNQHLAEELREQGAGYRNIEAIKIVIRDLCLQIASTKRNMGSRKLGIPQLQGGRYESLGQHLKQAVYLPVNESERAEKTKELIELLPVWRKEDDEANTKPSSSQ